MRRILIAVSMLALAMAQVKAQTNTEMRKMATKEHNEAVKLYSKEKASKDAAKRAKQLRKKGWETMASDKPMDMQITDDRLLASETMKDKNGEDVSRWIIHTSRATQGTYNAAIAQARLSCQAEIASLLETKLAGALEQKLSGNQTGADVAETVDKFHQRFKGIVDGCLTDMKRGLCMYRTTENGNYEVEVTYAYDKKVLAARLAKQAQKQMEMEGDEDLNGVVNDIVNSWE